MISNHSKVVYITLGMKVLILLLFSKSFYGCCDHLCKKNQMYFLNSEFCPEDISVKYKYDNLLLEFQVAWGNGGIKESVETILLAKMWLFKWISVAEISDV